eukprot:UN19097
MIIETILPRINAMVSRNFQELCEEIWQ